MDWLQVCVILFGNVAWILPLWLWSRSESRADSRQMLSMMQGIQAQNIEFHGRLCTLEERYIQMMQRFMEERSK